MAEILSVFTVRTPAGGRDVVLRPGRSEGCEATDRGAGALGVGDAAGMAGEAASRVSRASAASIRDRILSQSRSMVIASRPSFVAGDRRVR
jgi:hypothetical protein